jgi:uncharacterized protein YndB with AHSA1/START domain
MTEEPIRTIEVEVEVPGTPEQVWEAIATGPGIAAWFVPAEVEGREGGAIAYDMGGGMEESAVVTAWEPPRRFAGEEEWQPSEDRPAARLATEFLVEASSGGTCVVRLVSSLFAGGGDWGDELESMREGWRMFLENLRLYLTHFAGQRSSRIGVGVPAAGSLDEAWAELGGGLGIADAAEGERVAAAAGSPPLAGRVERTIAGAHHRGLAIRLDEPAPGVALVFVNTWLGRCYANVSAYLFGDEAADVAARDAQPWRAWLERRFSAGGAPAADAAAP